MEVMEHERLQKLQEILYKYSELEETIVRPTEQVRHQTLLDCWYQQC